MENLKKMLHEEIESQFDGLEGIEIGSEAYRNAVDGLSKLMDREIEISKLQAEREDKLESRAIETRLKNRQLMDDKTDKIIRNGLTAAGLVITAGLTVWGTLKTFKFEETGTITSSIGRGFIQRLTPRK